MDYRQAELNRLDDIKTKLDEVKTAVGSVSLDVENLEIESLDIGLDTAYKPVDLSFDIGVPQEVNVNTVLGKDGNNADITVAQDGATVRIDWGSGYGDPVPLDKSAHNLMKQMTIKKMKFEGAVATTGKLLVSG
jgi:hypothetical protein